MILALESAALEPALLFSLLFALFRSLSPGPAAAALVLAVASACCAAASAAASAARHACCVPLRKKRPMRLLLFTITIGNSDYYNDHPDNVGVGPTNVRHE